ncbi:hypothetical protein O181_112372 [Austropuccinia psidii MF-1]|uniref:DUF4939 domain-containing protein n=1 Tax=Austropuccinia psidii MF-1 TaxID=1389203 RepID=A0A9Q3K3L0_9BASI|nr:hypothetical protein [Austropuccinia psidii MF-1]
MPIQHSPPCKWTGSQSRAQAVLTTAPRAPVDGTSEVPQLWAQLDRGPHLEEETPSRKEGRGPKTSSSRGPALAQSNHPVAHNPGPSLLAIMHQMTKIMANLQEASSSKVSRPTALKTPSMEAPDIFDGTWCFKVRSFIQSCQLIFHSDLGNVSQDRKQVLYSTLFLIGRAAKWIEHYLSNITNKDPNHLFDSWVLFESKLFTLFGSPNEVRKAETELHSLIMKEGGHV